MAGRYHTADPLVVELAIIRQARGLSLHELSRQTGVSRSAIGRWENGETDPAVGLLRLYADVLGVGLDIVRPSDDTTRPEQMDAGMLADALQRLAAEAGARLTEHPNWVAADG